MLRIGNVPAVVVPGFDEFLGLVGSIGALRFEEPDETFAPDAITKPALGLFHCPETAIIDLNAGSVLPHSA